MTRLNTCEITELSEATIEALEPFRQNGKIAAVYLQFANSEAALQAYLRMEQSLTLGSLSILQLEAVKLWVSQQTGCEFCLSVHSFKAQSAGLDDTLQMAIRKDQPTGDQSLDALLTLARALFRTPGSVSQDMLNEARAAGLSDENLVDLSMAMSTIFFTNMANHINDSKSPLKAAPSLS